MSAVTCVMSEGADTVRSHDAYNDLNRKILTRESGEKQEHQRHRNDDHYNESDCALISLVKRSSTLIGRTEHMRSAGAVVVLDLASAFNWEASGWRIPRSRPYRCLTHQIPVEALAFRSKFDMLAGDEWYISGNGGVSSRAPRLTTAR